jgi:hypothetical protein
VAQTGPMVWRVVVADSLVHPHAHGDSGGWRELWGTVEWNTRTHTLVVSLDEVRCYEPDGRVYGIPVNLSAGVAHSIRSMFLAQWVESISSGELNSPLSVAPEDTANPSPYPNPSPGPGGSATAHRRPRKLALTSPVSSPIAPLVDRRAADHLEALDQLDAAIESLTGDTE